MITVVSLVLWCTLAAAAWWLTRRIQLLLNYAEELLRNGAKDRHAAGSRIQPEPEIATGSPVDVDSDAENERPQQEPDIDWQPDPDPATDPVGMPPIRRPQPGPVTVPAAAAIDAEWEQKRDAMVADMLAEIRGKS